MRTWQLLLQTVTKFMKFIGIFQMESISMDRVMEALLSLSDPSESIDLSLERVIDSIPSDSDKDYAINSAMRIGSVILESAMRSARKRSSKHNSNSWPLPSDLTIKVFAMLDTRSLCNAAATCSLFNKCASDSLCYADIDLTSVMPKVNNTVVSTTIQRAGKNLQSLKLGILPVMRISCDSSRSIPSSSNVSSGSSWKIKRPSHKESSVLTRSCLLALSLDNGAAGSLLRKLHLYNIDRMDSSSLCTALTACKSLLDLEVIGLHVEMKKILDSVSKNCHSIERLIIECSEAGRDNSLVSSTCTELVNCCPHIRSLAIRGFKLNDHLLHTLIKGFSGLKVADFSSSFSVTGFFLRTLGSGTYGQNLEILILRDCLHLKEVEVSNFLSAVISGDCKQLGFLDISNKDGLSAEGDWNYRCYYTSTPISRVAEARSDLRVLANFPDDESLIDIEQVNGSDESSSMQRGYDAFSPSYISSSDTTYTSNLDSENEVSHDANYAFEDAMVFDEYGD